MRLLHAKTYLLEEFPGPEKPGGRHQDAFMGISSASATTPEYAILSHTWGSAKEEVSFQDMQYLAAAKKKAGFEKIAFTCRQARANGLEYVWIDTCCIDKHSSAELSEAINSMFRWYKLAKVCYVYLADVSQASKDGLGQQASVDEFSQSRWFTRGWTLQELLAPKRIIFFTKDWNIIGTMNELKTHVANITQIRPCYLDGEPLHKASVAERMSWASLRQTSRVEDIAYSLLGIFDINMALLYGEGEKAFQRLQREIINTYDDQTILAWDLPENISYPEELRDSVLALAPSWFLDCADLAVYEHEKPRHPASILNRAVALENVVIENPNHYDYLSWAQEVISGPYELRVQVELEMVSGIHMFVIDILSTLRA
ncbi:hypothetical protein S40288_08954 [Stachybotrys chartarum IBT 40288]|nr:hypothetical protein S40288_08954 [Stachybotrys chartarum IBT 40288]